MKRLKSCNTWGGSQTRGKNKARLSIERELFRMVHAQSRGMTLFVTGINALDYAMTMKKMQAVLIQTKRITVCTALLIVGSLLCQRRKMFPYFFFFASFFAFACFADFALSFLPPLSPISPPPPLPGN
jgi:hypothetical protein